MRMMSPERLQLLAAFARQGTMTSVAAITGYSTSAISHQLAVLEQEAGTALLERDGRRVRLTPAGRRLVTHAERILGDLKAAHADLAGSGDVPHTVRVAAFATAITAVLLPICSELGARQPGAELQIQEREPDEVAKLIDTDAVDLGLVYDYSLRPRFTPDGESIRLLGTEPVCLITPCSHDPLGGTQISNPQDLLPLSANAWITNSRGADDDELAERVCGLAGFAPRIAHRADSLDIVQEMVAAGLGVALIPSLAAVPDRPGLVCRHLPGIPASRRIFARIRPGLVGWPPITLVLAQAAERAAVACAEQRIG